MPDLRAHLEVELRNGLIQGIHPRELARRFRKHYGGFVKDTERLMIAEMRRLQTAVQAETFERNGFKEYLFITAGDERVCPECAKLHGQHFKVSEMQVGENAPPMHPRCHCSTTAYMDGDKYKWWIEALANGEDVRWDEFEPGKESPQSAGGIVLTEQQKLRGKMQKNLKKDGEQHQRYRKVLGDMIPDSLQSFRKMKYNNTGKWNAMKHNYRIVNSYEVNAGSMTPEEILRLDDIAFNGKKGLFTGEAKNSANIGVMEIDGHIYYANSKATKETDPAYYNFKGNKADLVLMKPDGKRVFSTKVINHDRKVDSESKLFEFASDIISDGQHHSIKMLSERCMCESCLGVMSQFMKKYSNIAVDMVSGRKDRIEKNHNNPWKHRKYYAEKG